uniref:Uncharacterized protein n=1 Tax=Klebsiella pneumoniae TaxID=573 RepID=A0A6G8F5D9_KLEPN|nr:hypothetical protein [Klebsiella pneumoniae]QIZ18120.1 Uncharacterized protein [Klebsiella pneumoniae]
MFTVFAASQITNPTLTGKEWLETFIT